MPIQKKAKCLCLWVFLGPIYSPNGAQNGPHFGPVSCLLGQEKRSGFFLLCAPWATWPMGSLGVLGSMLGAKMLATKVVNLCSSWVFLYKAEGFVFHFAIARYSVL